MKTETETRLYGEFRAALAVALEGTGLEVAFGYSMPWIQEPGADSGYWVGFGLENWPHIAPHSWRTFLFISYVSDADGARPEPHCLDLKLEGTGARSSSLLALVAVAAVRADLERKAAAR